MICLQLLPPADGKFCIPEYVVVKNHKYHWKDEENPLPYKDETFDLVICNLNLHWSNDLNKTLKEINRVLRPDAAIIGKRLNTYVIYGDLHSEVTFLNFN